MGVANEKNDLTYSTKNTVLLDKTFSEILFWRIVYKIHNVDIQSGINEKSHLYGFVSHHIFFFAQQ